NRCAETTTATAASRAARSLRVAHRGCCASMQRQPAVQAVADAGWREVVHELPPIPDDTRAWDLGVGESAVLAWARDRPGAFALDLVAIAPVALLELPVEELDIALDLVEVVVGELAPLLADLALDLHPLSLERIGVHSRLLGLRDSMSGIPGSRKPPACPVRV